MEACDAEQVEVAAAADAVQTMLDVLTALAALADDTVSLIFGIAPELESAPGCTGSSGSVGACTIILGAELELDSGIL